MEEVFKDIKGYEGLYQVSNKGRVYSFKTKKFITTRLSNRGYLMTHLSKDSKRKSESTHRLVAGAFVHNPKEKKEVDHVDGNKLNNISSNLEWVTKSENGLRKERRRGKRGACFIRSSGRWLANIGVNRKIYNIGHYSTKNEAYEAFFKVYKEWHGVNPW